jgi:predicted transcriptional regulator
MHTSQKFKKLVDKGIYKNLSENEKDTNVEEKCNTFLRQERYKIQLLCI